MKFIDQTEIDVRSGDGGAGMVSFKAAKYVPKAGSDGGDGGFGGNVYLVGNAQLNTLSALYYRRMYAAENGERGGTNNCTGRGGKDLEIPVPVGTIAINRENGQIVAEILEHDQKICLAEGGKRGLGNLRFLSSTHQAPTESTSGGPGIEISLRLELKLIADVGFAGFPNAGKSTLLSVISAATPKIADYPFTTLTPQLGVVDIPGKNAWDGNSFVAADIPGLIEGASEGRGLGHEFLRHLERTKVIAFVIDAFPIEEEHQPLEAYRILNQELRAFSEKLYRKRKVVILTKSDLEGPDYDRQKAREPFEALGLEVMEVSAVAHKGLDALKHQLFEIVELEKNKIDVDLESDENPLEAVDQAKVEVVEKPASSLDLDDYIWMSRADEDNKFGI